MTSIKVKQTEWLDARSYQIEAFNSFKEEPFKYDKNGYIFTIMRIEDGIYLIREDLTKMPIADWNNVRVYLDEWKPAREYQKFAYFDYIYDNKLEKSYHSRGTTYIDSDSVELPYDNLDVNIIFKIIKYNGVIYMQKDDRLKTLVKITDNLIDQELYKNYDWFYHAFGFKQLNYSNTREKFLDLYEKGLLNVGNFLLFNDMQFTSLRSKSNITFENIVADVKDIHKRFNNVSIQIASQFNCLEMINQNITPLHGIKIYETDRTQGPIAVMCTPTALAWRNYLYANYETEQQINMIDDLLNYLKSKDNDFNWTMQNGYLFINNENLSKINRWLYNRIIYNEAKEKVKIGIHQNAEVFVDRQKYGSVAHIFCSGIPLTYAPNINSDLWDLFSKLILETQYELTLKACIFNGHKTCFLTKIGGGVFGMKKEIIIEAIRNALESVKNYELDVKLVHYGNIEQGYESIII